MRKHNPAAGLPSAALKGKDASLKEEKAQKGLIERASGGILCLIAIECLPVTVQDALITLLEKNTYTCGLH